MEGDYRSLNEPVAENQVTKDVVAEGSWEAAGEVERMGFLALLAGAVQAPRWREPG